MPDYLPPPQTRRERLWRAAESRGIPLRAILATVGVVVATFLVGKLLYRLRDVLLIMLVAGFIALILNPFVVALQRWKIRRRGFAVTIVAIWGFLVFIGLAVAFGYPLVNGISHLAQQLPTYVTQAEHGRGWIGHLASKYHVQAWVAKNTPKLVSFAQGLAKPALEPGQGRRDAGHHAVHDFRAGTAAAPGRVQDARRPARADVTSACGALLAGCPRDQPFRHRLHAR